MTSNEMDTMSNDTVPSISDMIKSSSPTITHVTGSMKRSELSSDVMVCPVPSALKSNIIDEEVKYSVPSDTNIPSS